ncbi:MAG: hypothetical protein JWQ11_1810, partial [Rhizobacter sp.]|nr:hypothetical protein [Rhizobacter sp.]
LAVIEPATGSILLVQLKHQDIYGMDVHSGHLRATRLKAQVQRWLASVAKWVSTVGEPGVRASLQLGKAFPTMTTFRVVITRHYSFPLKDVEVDEDMAFGNWNQFFNATLLAKHEKTQPSLADIVRMLKLSQEAGGTQEHLEEPRSLWVIDDMRFTIEQKPAGADAAGLTGSGDPDSPDTSLATPDSI